MAFEVRVDCPSCPVEAARVETWDREIACCRLGVPAAVRCQMCGHACEGRVAGFERATQGDGCPGCGTALDDAMRDARRCPFCGARAVLVDASPPRALAVEHDVERALDAWAREEGLRSAAELVEAYFALPSAREIHAAMTRGERVETTFDVADYLFSGGGGACAAGEPAILREGELPAGEGSPPATERVPAPRSIRPMGGPRDELLALASVAAADGEASADDQAVLLRAAEKRGIPPLAPEEVRVWRPNEIAPPPTLVDRERVLEEMFQMSFSDGELDESELRVVREYGRAWGIDPERVREWTELYSLADAGPLERWFRRIGLFLFPAR